MNGVVKVIITVLCLAWATFWVGFWVLSVWDAFKRPRIGQPRKKTWEEVRNEKWQADEAQRRSEYAKRYEDNEVTKRRQQREDESIEKWKAQYKEQLAREGKKMPNV